MASKESDPAPFEGPIHISHLLAASGEPEPQPIGVESVVPADTANPQPVPGDDKSQEG
jgi:hypothetical protein